MHHVQVVPWKNFNIRDDVFNLIGAERETWNFSFEDVHVDAATRIAQAAAENPLTERFIHVSCIGAHKDAASRRLRTKVRHALGCAVRARSTPPCMQEVAVAQSSTPYGITLAAPRNRRRDGLDTTRSGLRVCCKRSTPARAGIGHGCECMQAAGEEAVRAAVPGTRKL